MTTPTNLLAPLAGGALIGAAASVFWLAHGRRAGISGVLADVLTGSVRDERLAFLAGLLTTGVVVALVWPGAIATSPASLPILAIAGVLVGVGTRVGGGCTSGHGVCGVARLSRRSIVATITFVLVAAVTVFFTHHLARGAA